MIEGISRRDALALGGAVLIAPIGKAALATSPTPAAFSVNIEQTALDDTLSRIRAARWPRLSKGAGSQYGVDGTWFRDLMDYWAREYDWRAQEAHINRLPQFVASIGERRLHFVHARSANAQARPLVLLHGWPNSFYSFDKVIEPLSAPERFGGRVEDGFHVIVPSLPGFTFSEPPEDRVRGLRLISDRIHVLLTEVLGYPRYLMDGGDFGAVVADWLALDHPEAIIGEHANLVALRHKGAEYAQGRTGVDDPTSEETRFVADEKATFERESGYFHLQNTRPETIIYAMADSPVGTAAYLLDKWQKWTDTRRQNVDAVIGRDHLLTEMMLYVVTNSFATSIWPYAGFPLEPFSIPEGRRITVPFGFTGYPDPLNAPPPRHFVERSRSNIVSWGIEPTGGHFPYLEDPDRYVDSLRAFAQRIG
jgi:pimeloyl-ACP methyl ester carboxylesterase